MKRQKYKFPINLIIVLAVIFLAIFLLIGYIWEVLNTSDFFSVKQVVVRNSEGYFDYLKGKNIFSLDLDSLSQRVLAGCTDCRKVRFSRVLPDCIVADFVYRQPAALIKFYKNFVVDDQGILFYPSSDINQAGLPLIYGLETKIFAPKLGIKYKRPELDLALNIISEIKSNRIFKDFTLKSIDVSSLASASFFMLLPPQAGEHTLVKTQIERFGFEVRLGPGNIKQKLMILGGLIMQARKDWGNIKYIDLRFKEPLIKLNNAK
ncbi:MAG: cell division protein FtsQ/DivIB [Candidatus Omnitrophica bacterium]|jgi:cell division septal protein FtsQ|nr:cell division protein FtsQ/DivIB [Candidatus Omnitrophota bacterium]MDD5660971.1 cell division protein FtsQ/DivIB [Candidatus Omnitrophota bacterium]